MALAESIKVFWTRFGQFAEAMEYDPAEDLRQRVERLEQCVYVKSAEPQELDFTNSSVPKSDFVSKRVVSHD